MPRGSRKVRFSVEETHLTPFGGMWLIQRFCHRLRLRGLLQKYVQVPRRSGPYHAADLALPLLWAITLGLRRLNKTEILQETGASLELLGLAHSPINPPCAAS